MHGEQYGEDGPAWAGQRASAAIVEAMAQGWLPGLAWLDAADLGRSFIGAEPDHTVSGDRLDALDDVEAQWRADPSQVWMGWMTYELGVDALLGRAPVRRSLPGLCLRRYPAAFELGANGGVIAHGQTAALARLSETLSCAASVPPGPPTWPLQDLIAQLPAEVHRDRVRRALEHIAAGDSYQINLSQPFAAPWREPGPSTIARGAATMYGMLRGQRPASMGGVVDVGDDRFIVSNSPETLLDVRWNEGRRGAVLRSWPIKGTRPRHADPSADRDAQRALWHSEKDRAEHLMIVDLVRNDLGRIASPATVQASPQPSPMTLPTVHHLVTEVRAEAAAGTSLRTMVEAVFPGGSITGAPKRRTVELIDTLEQHTRGIYCGALVVLEPTGATLSIPIRTGLVDRDGLSLCAGGGIVIDSDPEAERLETIAKTLAFVRP